MGSGNGAARVRVREAGGEELLARLDYLDQRGPFSPRENEIPGPAAGSLSVDFDVVMIGGGLSLLLVPLLASRGLRVAVFDRGRIGTVHREWNASVAELEVLVDVGLLTAEELEKLILKVYDRGICSWHGGGTYPVTGVLDTPVDAHGLLQLTRTKALEAGAELFDNHELVGLGEGSEAVALRFRTPDGTAQLTARIVVDARGASSPYASGDLLCPTVGGVVEGLEEGDGPGQINPQVGEILATTEPVVAGRQHIWEAFPVEAKRTTVYLFYYAPAGTLGPGALLNLYDRFFATLPEYKRGATTLVRPTFGFITGWSRLSPPPRAPGKRIALVGDAAARHSPLTFCGFGATLRSLQGAADALSEAAESRHLAENRLECIVDDGPLHRGTGLLSSMMARPDLRSGQEDALNSLLDAAFSTLYEMGNDVYSSLLKDHMSMQNLALFLHRTSLKQPRVYKDVFDRLGPRHVGRWGFHIAREIAGV